jgi:hypothetical protein
LDDAALEKMVVAGGKGFLCLCEEISLRCAPGLTSATARLLVARLQW